MPPLLQREIDHTNHPQQVTIIGHTAIAEEINRDAQIAAGLTRNVLILGENGVGKGVLARHIHNLRGYQHPFVHVNCPALPESMAEDELFGHSQGAFTGAIRARQGKAKSAIGGTLFLDEIGELSTSLQTRLLLLTGEKKLQPVGSEREEIVDLRIISATNMNVAQALANGKLRTDLFHRLDGFTITIPPLRARLDDLPLLVDHIRTIENCDAKFSADALHLMMEYHWPGNIRELENVVGKAVARFKIKPRNQSEIGLEYVAPHLTAMSPNIDPGIPQKLPPLPEYLKQAETNYLLDLIRRNLGHTRRAAAIAGITERALHLKVRRLGLFEEIRRLRGY
ncbi:MAG: sigma 54-interacting transcriptional regulator [Patescibacteria group bacterium]